MQTAFPTEAQLTGRSSGLISQHTTGHSSIKWLHEVGNALGSSDGKEEGKRDGRSDGSNDGTGDGSGVGLQSTRSVAPWHSVGQHSGQPISSNGNASQSGRLKSTHNGGRLNGSSSKHAFGHLSIKYEHSVGMADGTGLGRSVGKSVGSLDGKGEGNTVGPGDGTGEGRSVGVDDGTDDGKYVGPGDGSDDGNGVGLQSIRS